ncbi:hypothetical protein DW064_14315 [Segatella copri]|uniref:Uncharacterized protein n=1 Tax=Segatella copri TaxID=165179 RepID=A0AA92V3F7_9BACT|nr:hypothetical protein DW064_14315 [Segatella copri]
MPGAPGAFILPPGITFAAALVNIEHLLGAFSWGSILTQAAKKFDVAFHNIKLFNMSLNGITLVLVPQYNGHRRVAELKIAGRRVKQR